MARKEITMRKLAAVEFLTVDGVMQGLGSPDEDTEGGFTHGGWGTKYAEGIDPSDDLGATSAYLFGRKTYQKMAAFWPSQPDTNPIAAHMNATPKYVATRTLSSLDWAGAEVLSGDLETSVGDLKADGEGSITILGSGVLVHELMQLNLVDEFRLFVHPLLLGTGKRLFRDLPEPRSLHLVGVDSTPLGSVAITYAIHA
jgi:dihydrofolate reductase